MARIRSIKPDMVQDVKLSSVSDGAERTFWRLVSQSDDAGLQIGTPRALLGSLYPERPSVTESDLEGWLGELVAIGSVALRETTDGVRVVQLVKWHRHQVIKKPTPSRILPRLRDLSGKVPPPSGNPTGKSVVEVGSRKLEVGGTSSEGGGGSAPVAQLPAAPSSSDHPAGDPGLIDRFPDDAARDAYLAYYRGHRYPDGFDASLRRFNKPITGGQSVDWPIIGAALVEMRGAGASFTPAALAGFVRKLGDRRSPAIAGYIGDDKRERMAALRQQLDDDIRAGRQVDIA
jgi:hypothetical protein